jgi:[ribosomal protein S5]-alanine N-acetyltransferase
MRRAITVRRPRPQDACTIRIIRVHPDVCRYQPIETRSVEELARMLERRGGSPLAGSQSGKLQWTVLVEGEIAGWVSVSIVSRDHHVGSTGDSLHPRFWGHGSATQALRDGAEVVMDPDGLSLERLEAVAATENLASRRVLEKTGFAYEGIARRYLIIGNRRIDHVRYARLRGE